MIDVIRHENSFAGLSKTTYKAIKPSKIDSITFLAEIFHKEVMDQDQLSGRNHKLKSLRRLQKGFTSILIAAMMVSPSSALAQTPGTLTTPTTEEITPNLVMEWGMQLSLITVAIGVAISGSLLAIAGIYRMLRKRKESEEWTTDIIKGLVQVLISIPVVYALYYLAQIVFKNLPILSGLN